jgi:hypothetical protein
MKIFFTIFCLLLTACVTDHTMPSLNEQLRGSKGLTGPTAPTGRLLYQYQPSVMCAGCHTEIHEQWQESMHSNSFTNPLFNKQYFKEVVPRAERDPKFAEEARKCIMCHAPVVYMNYSGLVSTKKQVERFEAAVTCDFCHTLAGYAANGDYLQNPSGLKQGPLEKSPSSHAEYSGFLQVGDFCVRCHNATNHNGVEVKSTYYEWRESSYGKRGFACQECHMNKNGFLKNGVAEFNSGVAAHINIGAVAKEQKSHDKLYSHSFPGAHSISQLEDALQMEFKVGSRSADSQGHFRFELNIDNERSGHKMPSGSSDLRFIWLSVTATDDDGRQFPVVPLPLKRKGMADYSIAGASPDDAAILGDDVPQGSRIYRSVFVDAEGHQTLFNYNSVKNIFDNRLNSAEVRHEIYELRVPPGFSGHVTLSANLFYRGNPSSFAKREDVPDFKPVAISSKQKKISVVTHSPDIVK